MASGKSFHLHWNNHLTNLRTLLEYLYNEQSFVDVTLSCSDGLIRAHKLVLSACSPYFDTIFRENPCKHPTVILRGISLREMQLIIEYMYVGSVDIPENELSGLLEIANELHIKGLVQDPGDNDDLSNKRASTPSPNRLEKGDEKGHENFVVDKDNKNHAMLTIKEEKLFMENQNEGDSMTNIINMAQVKMDDDREDISEKSDPSKYHYGFTHSSSNTAPDPDLFCNLCNRGFLNKQNMKRHMQTHSGVKPHQCQFCSLSFLRLSHLQRHHRVHTGERPFLCDQCDKQFSRSDKLKQHVALHHSGVGIPKQTKQRGRPRKVPFNTPINVNLTSPSDQKLTNENVESINSIPSLQAIHQFYNMTSNAGIPVVQ